MMLTTDISLLHDPVYLGLVKKFAGDQDYLTEQFGAAWCARAGAGRVGVVLGVLSRGAFCVS
jgi:catalase (peroxidase I)